MHKTETHSATENLAMQTTILRLHVNNHPGVMSQICGLFARRAFNMELIFCNATGQGDTSCIWLKVDETDKLEQVVKQLAKPLAQVVRSGRRVGFLGKEPHDVTPLKAVDRLVAVLLPKGFDNATVGFLGQFRQAAPLGGLIPRRHQIIDRTGDGGCSACTGFFACPMFQQGRFIPLHKFG